LLSDVPGSLVVVDLNGDNAPDLVVTNQNVIYTPILANNVSVYLNRAGALVKLTSSLNPSLVGEAITFTCVVTAGVSGSGTPTGTVTFKDGTVTLGTVTLVSAKAALTRSNLSAGQHLIKAFYSGDSTFNRNTSSTLKQAVDTAP
jgi:Bacterial Ig-like domain (group 3)